MKKGKKDIEKDSEHDTHIEKIYQKKTQLEHILLRPDSYIGSIDKLDDKLWVYDEKNDKFVNRSLSYVPGLYKIFDEILVNANDNIQRDKSMTTIKVDIDRKNNSITVFNNGKGIPIVIHKEHNVYVPELIFGHLLTSSNYNDQIRKITGGRNGYGAKLTNIFSKKFIVETADSKNKKKYTQVFSKNMTDKTPPEIKDYDDKDYTKITFYPDLKKFNMKELDDDIVALMQKRVYDAAGTSPPNVNVYLNNKKIPIKNFREYSELYFKGNLFDDKIEFPKIYENPHQRWEVILSMADSQFQQVSFVNGICTTKGGTHVNHVVEQVTERILEHLKKKNKDLKLKTPQIKQNLWIFVNSFVENPTFDSQTKETMTLKEENFGSKCELSEKFFKEVLKSPIINNIVEFFKAKEKVKLHKALSSNIKKSSRLLGIEKLEDANDAGTKNSDRCTLILTEGDSAKALAMSGLEVVGRDSFGVFPLKGKFLNVRDAKDKSIIENEEIQNLIKILGLQMGKNYESELKGLRYGNLMIMADQDYDGSHIKGLIINFIHHFWPSLIRRNGFLKEFVTPIVKVSKGDQTKCFYTLKEYKEWYDLHKQSGWKIKYYKGLGTSTPAEAKGYFKSIEKNRIKFKYINDEDDKSIDLAFNKNNSEMRKEWLSTFDPFSTFIDHSKGEIRIKDFINKELIFFSNADNIRSIPSALDGLKPSERKILYSCFKRNLKTELKVAQLAGYVAEHSAYHHGEASLCTTITSLAQDFVGTNNINLLMPIGQFGNRYTGPKSAASARYIYTHLSKLTRYLFREEDDNLLTYQVEEGMKIEPTYYLPILPLVLINGAEGIGTGWSTTIPQYNPRDIAENIISKLKGDSTYPISIKPWFRGYTGDISEPVIKNGYNTYTLSGKISLIEDEDDVIEISELPIGTWTRDYKSFLEKYHVDNKDKDNNASNQNTFEVEDIKEYHTDNQIMFRVTLSEDSLKRISSMTNEERLKLFKLNTQVSTSNMVLFNSENKLRKFQNVEEILDEFFKVRLEFYSKRKEYLLNKLKYNLDVCSNKMNFIQLILTNSMPFKNLNKGQVIELLKTKNFLSHSELKRKYKNVFKINSTDVLIDESQDEIKENSHSDYDYLMNMNIWSLTYDKVKDLEAQIEVYSKEIKNLENSDEKELWINDLQEFLREFDDFINKTQSRKATKITNPVKIQKKSSTKQKNSKVIKSTNCKSKSKSNNKLDDFIVDSDEDEDEEEEEDSYSEYSDDNSSSSGSESDDSESEKNLKGNKKNKSAKTNERTAKNQNTAKKKEKETKITENKQSIEEKSPPLKEKQNQISKEGESLLKILNVESSAKLKNYSDDVTKLSLKERLALRVTQGKIDDYLKVLNQNSTSQILKGNPNSTEVDKVDVIDELLGNKRNTNDNLENEINMKKPSPNSKGLKDNFNSEEKRSKKSNKKIIDDDDEDFII